MTQEMTIGEVTHSKPVVTLMVLKRNSSELTRPSQSGAPSPNRIGGSLLMVLQLVPRLQFQEEEFRRRLPVRPVRLSPGNTFAGITSRLPVVGAPNRLAIRTYVNMYVPPASVLPKSRAARMYVRMYVSVRRLSSPRVWPPVCTSVCMSAIQRLLRASNWRRLLRPPW